MSRTVRDACPLKPLTQRDLDERIGQVVAELFDGERPVPDDEREWAPVPIRAADFVQRMQRFLVYN
jgi:hypothetical protein